MYLCAIFVAFLVALSCHPAFAIMAGSPPDSPSARIDPNTSNSPWAGVGSVVVSGSPYSGVVIGSRFVLTAGHVAGSATPSAISFQVNAGASAQSFPARAVHRHPGFVGFNNPNLNDDLAIIELDTALPASIPVYPINATPIAAGATLTVVGYGGSGNGSSGVTVAASAAVKRVGKNNADQLLDDDEGLGRKELFLFDFDGGGAPNFLGGPSLGNAVETSFAGGDSGSPAFVQDSGGHWLLTGINTFVLSFASGPTTPGTFGTGGGGQLLAAHVDWINQVMGAEEGDIPMLPAWALSLFASVLLVSGRGLHSLARLANRRTGLPVSG